MSSHRVLGLLIGIAVLVRLPFLPHGFGLDPDAARNMLTAERLVTEGVYAYSRAPGYPVHEVLLAVTRAYTSPLIANGISLVAFILSALTLHRILVRVAPETALAYTATYLFLPIGLIASTEAMDYYLALLFILLSLLLVSRRKTALSAVALGAAVGTRLTSGAALFAVLPHLPGLPRVLVFLVGFAASALAFYAPVLWTYGTSFFTFYDVFARPSPFEILRGGMVLTWGTLGAIAVLAVLAMALGNALTGKAERTNPFLLGGLALIVLYWIAFFRLPHEAEYLLPTVAGVLLVASVSVRSARVAWLLAIAVALSSLVSIGPGGVSPGVWQPYLEARKARTERVACISGRLEGLPDRAVVVVPTSVDHAYLSQAMYAKRPDLAFLIDGEDAPSAQSGRPTHRLDTTITEPMSAPCTAVIVPHG